MENNLHHDSAPLAPERSEHLEKTLRWADRLKSRQVRLHGLISRYDQKLRFFQNARLVSVGIVFIILAILTTRPGLRLESVVIGVFLIFFVYFVVRTRRLARFLAHLKGLDHFLSRQEKRLRGLPSGRSCEIASRAAEERTLPRDIGLIGAHSLWTLLDETLTDGGMLRLLDWMTAPPMASQDLKRRQEKIKSLRSERWFFTRLTLEASASDFRLSSQQILKFLNKPFATKNFGWLTLLNIAFWVLGFTLIFVSHHNHWNLEGVLFGIYVLLTFMSLNQVSSPFLRGVGLSHHLSLLAPIFENVERRAGYSEPLKELCPVTQKAGPSREARKLNLVLGFMSIQANPLLYILVNALLPWTMTAIYFLERRRKKIAYTFPQCLDELAELEAYGSLVIFEQFHTQVYPQMEDAVRKPRLNFKKLYHPLIPRQSVVANDFHFQSPKSVGLLTGSNMSGKSTFLRTVGLNQTLANMGAPVFATEFSSSPMSIETCIEVSDSLRDGYSYFYAEVRKLKALLEQSKTTKPMLFLIDEIFRGTNNRERNIGSRAVIRTLADSTAAIGFVSTHDLELTVLEKTSPSILNLHFREDFSEVEGQRGEMIFSYLLRLGPCPTTNALKIMKREGIDVQES